MNVKIIISLFNILILIFLL